MNRLARTNASRLDAFRASAKKAAPTRKHRAALWENMLGTVYATNAAGEARYFDYDYKAALDFIGQHSDVRSFRLRYAMQVGDQAIPAGKLVWFVVREEAR